LRPELPVPGFRFESPEARAEILEHPEYDTRTAFGELDEEPTGQSHHMELADCEHGCGVSSAVEDGQLAEVVADAQKRSRGRVNRPRRAAEDDVERVHGPVPRDHGFARCELHHLGAPHELA